MNDSTLSKLSKAKNLIKGAVEEGVEELIQNPISRAMQKLVYDGDTLTDAVLNGERM